jgi:hypothetical protein
LPFAGFDEMIKSSGPYQYLQMNQDYMKEKIDLSNIIKFGKSHLKDYQRINRLGKGTYGEVWRCIHVPSGC